MKPVCLVMSLFATAAAIRNKSQASVGDEKCMRQLGCFAITNDFFHPLYRPLNLLPRDRVTVGTRFLLFTRRYPKEWHPLDANDEEALQNSPLDPKHPTRFIVHGFWDNTMYGKWMEIMKDNLLLFQECNVVIVDWSKGNGAPYTQAVANSRVVGAEIALLITALQRLKGISALDCHIIGHSLGAHIAGYAGERLKKLGRISAVDPARPYFQHMPPSVRIDSTDADFVDVIHTDSASYKFLALGMSQAVGHVDFYPNNGRRQPGCTTEMVHSIFLEGLIEAGRRFIACNHQRAVDFFTHSINYRRAVPVGYNCPRWEDYQAGKCSECGPNGQRCAIMGIRAEEFKPFKNDSQPLIAYLTTSGTVPFWVYTYHLSVKLCRAKSSKDRKGSILITIRGSKRDFESKLMTR